jgi:hypothetical protein
VIHIDEGSEAVPFPLKKHLEDSLRQDDVLCEAFLKRLILVGTTDFSAIDTRQISKTVDVVRYPSMPGLLSGPYLADEGFLRPAFRLYGDGVHAMSLPLRRSSKNKCVLSPPFKNTTYNFRSHTSRLVPLRVAGSAHNTISVAVPSRLRFNRTPSLPLAGVRITVKDIFDLEGIRTSLGSRDHLRLYPPASQTALAVQSLIESGCELTSLSKMCSMVLKQEPTQSIEFLAPMNPRADGWQSPSGGSSGQASAIAQYDWLDIAIASDCTYVPSSS